MIALIPTKNEEWILGRALACASIWADYIVVADQGSSDSTREIARSFSKVILLDNSNLNFSEADRQRLMIEAARTIPGRRVLVSVDADEILSANVTDSSAWRNAMDAEPGTVITFAKLDLHPTPDSYCLHSAEDRAAYLPFAYVDDGADYEGGLIHATRVPQPANAPTLQLDDIVLMHYSMCNMARFESKDRWYACFERVQFPEKSIVAIHRQNDWVDRLKANFNIRKTRPEWFNAYEQAGIDVRSAGWETPSHSPRFWWDFDILRMFHRYGIETFAMLDLWSIDWEAVRQDGLTQGIRDLPSAPIAPPRRIADVLFRQTLIRARKSRGRRYVDGALRRVERLLYSTSRKVVGY